MVGNDTDADSDRLSAEVVTPVSSGTLDFNDDGSFTYVPNPQFVGTATFSYDANGNRTDPGYVTGSNNQLTNDGVWTYTYDAEGNLRKKSKGASAETWTYAYHNENHLVSRRPVRKR